MDPDVFSVKHIKSSILDEETYNVIVDISHAGKQVSRS